MTVSAGYALGKYGGNTSTSIFYVPIIAEYKTSVYSLKFTVPYLRIIGPGNVVSGINPIVLENESDGSRRRSNGGFQDDNVGSGARDGLGDIIAAGSYTILDDPKYDFLARVTGKIKIGTADRRSGLGTGENDYLIQLDLSKSINRFTVFGSAGYRFLGDPPGINLNNGFIGTIGSSYRFSLDTGGGLIFNFAKPSSNSSSAVRELTAFISFYITPISKLQVYVLRGFSNGSPDYSSGVSYSYIF
ncbi:MAG: transporter [Burkholderiales bacterium]